MGASVSLLVRRCLNGLKRLWVEISGSETALEEVGDAVAWSIRVGGAEAPPPFPHRPGRFWAQDTVGIPSAVPALPSTERHLNS